MIQKKNEIQNTLVYIAGVLSNISNIEGLAITFYRGVYTVQCTILCIQEGNMITEKILEDNFGIRKTILESKTGIKVNFRVISSNSLSERVESYNAMDLKEFMNSEILVDKKGRLVKLQTKLGNSSKVKLGSYFNQIDLDTAARTLSMYE